MIMSTSSDALTRAFSESAGIRVAYVDVTDTARTLEQRHLCGPAAGRVMAESLSAVALVGVDVSRADETVSFRMRCEGPVEGVLVELTAAGDLRGYTHRKVINELDDRDELQLLDVVGSHGSAQVIRSLPGRIISQATLEVVPPTARQALEQYFNVSMQTPTRVATYAETDDGYLSLARGLTVECMPDGDWEKYRELQALFEDGSVVARLAVAPSLERMQSLLALPGLRIDEPQNLQFGCRCGQARVEEMVAGLGASELADMAALNKDQSIVCHMCGDTYTVKLERIRQFLDQSTAK